MFEIPAVPLMFLFFMIVMVVFVFSSMVYSLGSSDESVPTDEDYITYPSMRNKKKIEKFVQRCKL